MELNSVNTTEVNRIASDKWQVVSEVTDSNGKVFVGMAFSADPNAAMRAAQDKAMLYALQAGMRITLCRCCNSYDLNIIGMDKNGYLAQCNDCDAIFGRVTEKTYNFFVKPYWHPNADQADRRYFDFDIIDADQPTRYHGWYEPKSGLICQVG